MQSDGWENRVSNRETPKIIQLERREGICYSKSKGNENRPTQNVITPFLRWGIDSRVILFPLHGLLA